MQREIYFQFCRGKKKHFEWVKAGLLLSEVITTTRVVATLCMAHYTILYFSDIGRFSKRTTCHVSCSWCLCIPRGRKGRNQLYLIYYGENAFFWSQWSRPIGKTMLLWHFWVNNLHEWMENTRSAFWPFKGFADIWLQQCKPCSISWPTVSCKTSVTSGLAFKLVVLANEVPLLRAKKRKKSVLRNYGLAHTYIGNMVAPSRDSLIDTIEKIDGLGQCGHVSSGARIGTPGGPKTCRKKKC